MSEHTNRFATECNSENGCDDGNACTNDTCDDDGCCVHTPVPCPSGQECDPANGTCFVKPPCVPNTDTDCGGNSDCNDGNPCTTDTCSGGGCTNINNNAACDDDDPCTSNDTCSNGTCVGTPECTAGAGCDDGLFCNGSEVCNNGCCQSGNPPCSGGACCSEETDTCGQGSTCTSDGQCNDGDSCTADTCTNGCCVNAPDCVGNSDCNDGNPCTTDTCSSGCCTNINNNAPCNDGLFCNGTDTCNGGFCSVHAGNPCPGPDEDANCSESCSETSDNCTAPDPNGSSCGDGLFCNGMETCLTGQCGAGSSPCRSTICLQGIFTATDDPCNETNACCTEITLVSPADEATSGLTVTFVFNISCAPEGSLSCRVSTDFGACPCDNNNEDEFSVPEGQTSLTVTLPASRYVGNTAGPCFDWDVKCSDSTGNEICTDVARTLCIQP